MKKYIGVEIPHTPNFIKVGKSYESITKFTDAELRAIGKEWTANLIKSAQSKREFPIER